MDKILNAELLKAFNTWQSANAINGIMVKSFVIISGVFTVLFVIRWISDHAYQMAMKQYANTPKIYRLFGKINLLSIVILIVLGSVGWNGVNAIMVENVKNATSQTTKNDAGKKQTPETTDTGKKSKTTGNTNEDTTSKNTKTDNTNTDSGISSKLDATVEEKIRDFKGDKGTDGSYREAARQLASLAGLSIDWSISDIGNSCSGQYDQERTVAVFCSAIPDKIFVNELRSDYAQVAGDPSFLDYIRHEIAHQQITLACSTPNPAIVNGRSEAVANSYAIKYLGANAATLSDAKSMGLQYAPDDESNKMAEEIHTGSCTTTDGPKDVRTN